MSAIRKVTGELNAKYGDSWDLWRDEPFIFGEEVLGLPRGLAIDGGTWTEDQIKLVDSYMKHKYTACTSGNSTGKTFALAFIFLHFLVPQPDSIVITTSASWELLEDTLWREIRYMYRNARMKIGGELTLTKLDFGEKWYGLGLSTDDPTRFQGHHATRVLLQVDEATGVHGDIFKAGDSMVSGPNDRVICTANPTDGACYYAQEVMDADKAIKKGEYTRWNRVVIDAENHPNVRTGRTIIPGAVTREQVEAYALKYGKDHPEYLARVNGKYSETSGRLFPDWSEARHTYDPSTLTLERWWSRWISIDWGFAHNSAALFWAWDGLRTYVYDEFVANNLVAAELADAIGKRANPGVGRGFSQKFDAIYLAHDAFGRQGETGTRSRADIINDILVTFGLPAAQRASTDRVSGFNLVTALLRQDALLVSKKCVNLIEKMPLAMREVKKGIVTEDGAKFEGDDEIDSLYKGIMARAADPDIPRELARASQLTAKTPHDLAMQSRILDAQEKAAAGGGVFVMRGRRYGTGG